MNPTTPVFEVTYTFSLLKEHTKRDSSSKANRCPLIGYEYQMINADVGLDSALFDPYQDNEKGQTIFDLKTGREQI